jgi:hypothetical protein
MTRRVAVLLATPQADGAAPPGVPPLDYALALLEDTYEVLQGLAGVEAAVAVPADEPWRSEVRTRLWPGTPLLPLPGDTGPNPAGRLLHELANAASVGVPPQPPGPEQGAPQATQVVLVAADAPDLPGLVLAKCFSALENTSVAAAPALRGGLVALGCRLPVPDWLTAAGVGLDTEDAPERLRAAAPRRSLVLVPPWRRLRLPADIASLDPGLEGWEATRALLSGEV